MTVTAPAQRTTAAARRGGYAVSVLVNAALLLAVNRWPGWEAVPFLTDRTHLVTGLVNLSIVVNLAANVVYLVRDPGWLKAFGDTVTTAVGLVAVLRIWEVFPFDFGDDSFDWALVARVVLVVAIVGCVIGVVAAFVTFVVQVARSLAGGGPGPGSGAS
jgi:hypothetical protein